MGATRMEGEFIHSRGFAFSQHAVIVDSPCGRHTPRSESTADARLRAFLVRGTRGHARVPHPAEVALERGATMSSCATFLGGNYHGRTLKSLSTNIAN